MQLFLLQAAAAGRDGVALLKRKANPAIAALHCGANIAAAACRLLQGRDNGSRDAAAAGVAADLGSGDSRSSERESFTTGATLVRSTLNPPVDWRALSVAVESGARASWLGWVSSGRSLSVVTVKEQAGILTSFVHRIAMHWAEEIPTSGAAVQCILASACSYAFLLLQDAEASAPLPSRQLSQRTGRRIARPARYGQAIDSDSDSELDCAADDDDGGDDDDNEEFTPKEHTRSGDVGASHGSASQDSVYAGGDTRMRTPGASLFPGGAAAARAQTAALRLESRLEHLPRSEHGVGLFLSSMTAIVRSCSGPAAASNALHCGYAPLIRSLSKCFDGCSNVLLALPDDPLPYANALVPLMLLARLGRALALLDVTMCSLGDPILVMDGARLSDSVQRVTSASAQGGGMVRLPVP